MDSQTERVDDGRSLGVPDGEARPEAHAGAPRAGAGQTRHYFSADAPEYVPGPRAADAGEWPGAGQAADSPEGYHCGGDAAAPRGAPAGAAFGWARAEAWPRADAPLWHPAPPGPSAGAGIAGGARHRRASLGAPSKAERAIAQLRQLLDFYFEPFNLHTTATFWT
ncbi:unnamed protein product [Prorocentrum cordatum]|uniref:Uncharacterized protein n=1 Tax=Prorocentrum cordatum TaxID=2364126 RepID=A0ABN9RHL7_9DINO|nr:unnamed protein product [Polarella glacialis]